MVPGGPESGVWVVEVPCGTQGPGPPGEWDSPRAGIPPPDQQFLLGKLLICSQDWVLVTVRDGMRGFWAVLEPVWGQSAEGT